MIADRISVVLTCYNYGRYLADAIKSVLNQDYTDLELIVVNDGSSDNSLDIMQALSAKHGFTVVDQPNAGVAAATQAGFELSTGEYFVFFDADDIMLPQRLSIQHAYLKANPHAGCCGANYVCIDEVGNKVPGAIEKKTGSFDFGNILRGEAWIGTPTSMYRTQAILDAGGFDTRLPIQDQPIELQVSYAGWAMDIISDVVTLYRQHGKNMSHVNRKTFPTYLQSIERYRDHPDFIRAKRNLINAKLKDAVISDKPFARHLFALLPLKYWNRKTIRRFRHYLFRSSGRQS